MSEATANADGGARKRQRRASSSSTDASASDDGAATKAAKTKSSSTPSQSIPHESLFLSALPSADRYYKSFMHRDALTYVAVTPYSDFCLTASVDGHVKFWKKHDVGVEFVKHYKAHLGPVTGLAVSADGGMAATISQDGSAKVFDVVNFDLINLLQLGYTPRACCWVHRRGRADSILAIAEEGSNKIRLYSGRGDGTPMAEIDSVHRAPVHLIAYNEAYDCVVSADVGGMIEYWSPEEPYELPKRKGLWEFKSKTDLFEFKKSKSVPTSLTFSSDYSKFVAVSTRDRQLRIFDFATGKVMRRIDESLKLIQEGQANGTSPSKLDDMEFGRRLALERDLDKSADGAEGSGIRSAAGGPAANAVFDQSGNFLLYGSMFGIKVVNVVTGELAMLLGKDETVRFLNVSLFQNASSQKGAKSLALLASDNPLAKEKAVTDPTLFCTAYKRARFYMFTRQEPEADPRTKAGAERDVFNEKPTREEQTIASLQPSKTKSRVASSAVLHTTAGDIHLRLFPDLVPKTVENFVGLAAKGYYDGVLFHRVIPKFMLQTGDPLGDGTGGESLWGGEFEDEFRKELRHDRPYTLSMANAGPNTNGSQFFITTVPTPHLDNKHTVFGRAVAGLDVVHSIENARTDKFDKPREDIKIMNITIE